MSTTIFLVSMISGTLFMSVHNIFIKKLLTRGWSEQSLIAITSLAVGIVFAPMLFWTGLPLIQDGFWPAFTISLILNIIGHFAWYKSYSLGDMSVIAPLRLLIPILVIFTGFFVLGEMPTMGGVAGIFTTFLGLFLLFGTQAKLKATSIREVLKSKMILWGLVAVVGFSIAFPFDKQTVITSSAVFSTSLIYFCLGFANLLWIKCAGFPIFPASRTKAEWKELLGASLCLTAAAFLVRFALLFSLAAYAASIKRLEAVWTVLLAAWILKEKGGGRKMLAVLVMLAGVALTLLLG